MRLLGVVLLLTACAHTGAAVSAPPARSVSEADALAIKALEQDWPDGPSGREKRLEVEWELVKALEHAGLLNLAFFYAVPLARAPAHPHHLEALEAVLRLQESRQDDFLAPSLIERLFTPADHPVVSEGAMARVAWLRARIAFRRGELEAVVALCSQVPPNSTLRAGAEYLKAMALSDLRLVPARTDEAVAVLEQLLTTLDARQLGVDRVHPQALLALGRLAYRKGHWADSVRWYEQAAQFASVRARALFEQSLPLLQERDWAGALTRLRSAEVRGSGIAEADLTEAMVLHFSGDAAGAENVLERIRLRGGERVVDWKTAEPAQAAEAWQSGKAVSPEQLSLVREDLRLVRLFASIESLEEEQRLVADVASWQGTATGQAFATYLSQNLGTLRQVSGALSLARFKELQITSAVVVDQAEIVGIEVALTRRDLNRAIERAERVLAWLPEKGPPTSDMLFRVAVLRQARAEVMQGAEAVEERAQVAQLIERILAGDPTWERLDEARHFLDRP